MIRDPLGPLRQRGISLDLIEVLKKMAEPPAEGDWLLAVDPDTLAARIVEKRSDGSVPDVVGHEDLFPLGMVIENPDGFLKGGDWLVATTMGSRQHDGAYRSYWIEWRQKDAPESTLRARDFLKMARHDGIAAMTSVYPFIICYLAHQRCEKFLKAFLAYHNLPVPRTHDLERLLTLCKSIEPSSDRFSADLKSLRPYGVEIRYTSDKSQAQEDFGRAWNISRQVGAFVKRRLPLSVRTYTDESDKNEKGG